MSEIKHGLGSGGNCVCVKCGHMIPHQSGIPCREERCPKCGGKMLREGSPHHIAFLEKQKQKGKA